MVPPATAEPPEACMRRARRSSRRGWLVAAANAFACVVAMSCTELLVWRWLGRPNDTAAVLAVTRVVATAAAALAALLAICLPPRVALFLALLWPIYAFADHLDLSIHVAFIHSFVVDLVATLALAAAAVALLARPWIRFGTWGAALLLFIASAIPIRSAAPANAPGAVAVRPPDVILIVMDTTRRDHLSLYGYPRPTTPNLDRLARTAAVYEEAWSASNWTPASHATMFTGLLPAQHGVDGEAQPPFEIDVARLPQVLHDAGYATAGFPANPNLLARGWERGFDDYHAPWVRGSHTWIALLNELIDAHGDGWIFQHSTQRVLSLARDWWADHAARPRFLFINLIDPHFPYQPPKAAFERMLPGTPLAKAEAVEQSPVRRFLHPGLTPAEREAVTALYDGEVAALDAELGAFFDWLERRRELDSALICITADHGERLGERGLLGHDVFPDPTLLRVPLVARLPARITAERVNRRVGLDGLPGQILRWVGLDAPGAMGEKGLDDPGRELVCAQLEEPRGFIERLRIEDPKVDVSALLGDVAFVSDGHFAWTGSNARPDAEGRLFDLDHDAEFVRDVTAEHPEIAARLARIGRNLPAFPPRHEAEPIDPADEAKLRASGYVSQSK